MGTRLGMTSASSAPHSSNALTTRIRGVRALSETLAAALTPEDCCAQSMPDASPTKWHLAHSSWFFETFLLAASARYRRFDPSFDYLFNSYYEAVGARHPRSARGLLTRPSLADAMSYRRHVTEHILELVEARHGELGDMAPVLELGLQHEQQHQELIITDIKHLLGSNPRLPAYHDVPSLPLSDTPPLGWLSFHGGLREVGHAGDGFAFDNELPRHRTFLEPYYLATRLVTNGEYLDFVRDGGYCRPELWLSDGLRCAAERNWSAPLYWEGGVDDTQAFTLAGLQSLKLQEPVCHVSYYEADAFARWAGARLPSEFEWENAAAEVPVTGNLLNLNCMRPSVAVAEGEPLLQVFGDAWEWTASAYLPYPGYRPAAGALGEYNGKFMCNQMVLRGGSCATPIDHVRASYRNFFPADARWQFTGIRLARSA